MKKQLVEFWYGTCGSNERPCVYFRIKGDIHSKFIEKHDKRFYELLEKVINDFLEYGWKITWIEG